MWRPLLFLQLCSWWTTSMRCTCGRAGGLRTARTPARLGSAGTRTGSVPWRLSCSTAKVMDTEQMSVEDEVCSVYREEAATSSSCILDCSALSLTLPLLNLPVNYIWLRSRYAVPLLTVHLVFRAVFSNLFTPQWNVFLDQLSWNWSFSWHTWFHLTTHQCAMAQ